jgi:hypothetical protein
MRRGLAWGAGFAGVVAAFFLRRKRGGSTEGDPAEELRLKLAASREAEMPAPEPAPEPEAKPADAESRRREVHEQARAAIDEMRDGDRP